MERGFIIVGLILTLVATVFLFLGSKHPPWNMQSIGGKTDKELTFFKQRKNYTSIGFVLLFLGFLLQLIGVIIQR